MSSIPDLPERAGVVVIGGGVVGVSTAYQLARAGVDDVLLLDRSAFGSGSTCKAAGGIRGQFSDTVNIELGLRSLAAFDTFADDFDQPIDLEKVGYLFVLDQPEQVAAFAENVARQNALGLPSRLLSPQEAGELCPVLDLDGVLAAAFSPTDGHCTPEAVVAGYVRAARRAGARLVSGVAVTGLELNGDQIVAVQTSAGSVAASAVVCAAGAWSREIGGFAGVDLPVVPVRRQILTTAAVPGLPVQLPMTIDFATSFYFHAEGRFAGGERGLLLGMSDPDEPPSFNVTTSQGWLPGLMAAMQRRAPALLDAQVTGGWAGLYELTPDHNALIGRSERVPGFFYATGFSGHGFLMGPAVGEVMRDLYLGVDPVVDVSALDLRRFESASANAGELNIV